MREESETERMLRAQREWQKARKDGGVGDSRGKTDGTRTSPALANGSPAPTRRRKWPVLAGVGLLAVGVAVFTGKNVGPLSEGGSGGIFGLAKDAPADCKRLAASPIEGGQDKFGNSLGVTLPRMNGPAAIAACSSAVEKNPDDAASWHRLARAYLAAVKHSNYSADEYSVKYVEALQKSAHLGNIPSLALLIFLSGQDVSRREALARTHEGIEELNRIELKGPEDYFYKAAVLTRAIELESVIYLAQNPEYNAMDWVGQGIEQKEYKKSRQKEPEKLFSMALNKAGGLSFFQEVWDFKALRYCKPFDYICNLSEDVFQDKASPQAMIAVGAYLMDEAYRITDSEYANVGSDDGSISNAKDYGLSVASQSHAYADLAVVTGGEKFRKPAQSVMDAFPVYEDYAYKRYTATANEARQARQAAWFALAGAVVMAMANSSGNGAGSEPSEESVSDYVSNLNTHMCNSMALEQSWGGGVSGYEMKRAQYGC